MVKQVDRTETRRKAIFEALRMEIRSGKYVSSTRFPSETALARRFKCSRQSVVHALMSLEDLGLLCRRRGAGTFLTKKARRFGASIGLILPGLGYEEIFSPIFREISRLAQKEGMSLLFGGDPSSAVSVRAARTMELARQFVEKKVAGVIFQPIEFVEQSERYNQDVVAIFEAAGIPVVLIDCDVAVSPKRSACDVVGINNFNVGRVLAQHMLEMGARNVKVLRKPLCATTVMCRALGAQTVLGAKRVEDILVTAEPTDEQAISHVLRGRRGVDAFICGNDVVASRLLVTLRKLGKRVPEDVLIAGVDDVEHAALVTPPLTTIHQPCEAIAATAFDCLLTRIDAPNLPPCECLLPAPLVVRASTQRKNRKVGM